MARDAGLETLLPKVKGEPAEPLSKRSASKGESRQATKLAKKSRSFGVKYSHQDFLGVLCGNTRMFHREVRKGGRSDSRLSLRITPQA